MAERYINLGFTHYYTTNPYGIRILFGTEGKDDWCIEIPAELIRSDNNYYKSDKPLVMYCISEEETLRMAEKYTRVAIRLEAQIKR